MARATADWTDTVIGDWQAGDGVRETTLLQQVLQNLEYLAQSHDHTGDPNGGALAVADPKAIWFYEIDGGEW